MGSHVETGTIKIDCRLQSHRPTLSWYASAGQTELDLNKLYSRL